MGFFGDANPWGGSGGMGQQPSNPWNASISPPMQSPWGPSGSDQMGYVFNPNARNPFSSFAPAPQGPAGGPAPMQPQQPQQAQSDPLMQTGFQPAPLNAGGVPGYGGGMGAMDKFMGQIPQQGPMGGQAGGNMSPQQPSNPFAALGRFGW